MPARKLSQDDVTEVARRRLELLSAELAELRPQPEPPGRWAEEPAPWQETSSRGPVPWDEASPRRPVPWDEPAPGHEPLPEAAGPPGRHARRSLGVADRLAGWLQDRLPPTLQGRTSMAAAHLLVVGLVVTLGLGLTAWWITRALGGSSAAPATGPAAVATPLVGTPTSAAAEEAVTAGASPSVAPVVAPVGASVTAPGTAAPPASAGAAPAGASAGQIVVDVAGKVRRPGIATLPAGSRVADALEAAGGARPGTRLSTLNLARVLVDGEQVLVGIATPPGVAASAASGATGSSATGGTGALPVVNINTATEQELEELPGVGPVTASSILEFRAEKGRFSSVDELLEVSGIGDATLAKIAPYVSL